MANTKQAKKRAVQNVRDQARNRSVRTHVRSVLKKTRTTAQSSPAEAKGLLAGTASALDVAARKGVLHKRTAARLKSRVAKAVAKASAPAQA